MSSFTRVAEIAELPDGTMKKVTVGEKEILIARSGSRYFGPEYLRKVTLEAKVPQ